jgi:hypothetical protein
MSDAVEAALRVAGHWVSGVASELGRSPWPVSAGVVAAGLVVLLAGARARRPVAVVGAAGVAAVATLWLGDRAGATLGIPMSTLAAVSAAVAGAVAAVLPQLFPALAGALPAVLLAGLLAPDDRKIAVIAAGALLGGLLGVLAARPVAAAVASGVGALAVALGTAGALGGAGPGRALLAHPMAILAAVTVLAVAGTAFQYSRAWGRGARPPSGKPSPGAPVKGAAEPG